MADEIVRAREAIGNTVFPSATLSWRAPTIRDAKQGKVYFFGSPDGSFIKIGYTGGSLSKRKNDLLAGQFVRQDLVLLVAVPGTPTHERYVKDYFKSLRMDVNSTETFRPEPMLVQYINWLRQQWWVCIEEDCVVDAAPSWNEWMPTDERRVGFMEDDPYELIPRHRTYSGPLAGTAWDKLSTPEPVAGDDFYTDPKIIEAARSAMDGIDVDAASHWMANREHKVPRYFHLALSAFEHRWTREPNGLGGPSNVWLNPPYGDNAPWFAAILRNWENGDIRQLCMLSPMWVFTAKQARSIVQISSAMVLLSPTPPFWGNPNNRTGTNHPHGIIYLGDSPDRFIDAFKGHGIPMQLRG